MKHCMHIGHGAAFMDDHGACRTERIWQGYLMQRSQKMCPQASSVTGRRGRQRQIEHEVFGDATVHPIVVETLFKGRLIDLDACQARREAWRIEAERPACANARRCRIRSCCAIRLGLGNLQAGLTG